MSDDINLNGPNPANPTPVEPAGIGERGVPGVGRTKRKSPFRMLPIVIGMVLVLLFGAIAVGVAIKRWSAQHHAESEAARAEAAKEPLLNSEWVVSSGFLHNKTKGSHA
ncbi:hypothetical protein [Paraburkholderia unamae]|uniref:Uncharacterized protein n=1 Tax=Paraburkholderia unamae TaxID=219649 RepID=A0ACC6RM71_9BURK